MLSSDFLQDVRFALRQLAKTPTFTLVAVTTLALGIGSSAAIFSVVDAVLLHPLAYSEPERLVMMWQHDLRTGAPLVEVSYNEFKEWRREAKGFDGLAAQTATNFRVNLTGKGDPIQVESALVSASFFPLLGVRPAPGRAFLPEDDKTGAPPVALMSHGFWKRQFGSDPALVGSTLYVPYQQWNFGRMDLVLRTSVDPLSVAPALRSAVLAGDPELPLADVTTLERAASEAVAGPRFTALLLGIFAAVAVIMAAVGIYGVMASSMARRTREIGVRMALGALPADVLRMVLRQIAVLVGAGVAIGLTLALASNRALAGLLYGVSSTDPATFAATALGLALVALSAGLLAARRATSVDPMVALRYE